MVDKHSALLETLLIAASLVFTFTLALYAIVFGGNPVNRIGFAVFISAFPAALTLMTIKLLHLSETCCRVVLVYAVVFIATVLTQAVLRSMG